MKQYLMVLFISIFAACSGQEKKETQGNLTITNLTPSSSSKTAEGESRSIPSLEYSKHFGTIPFSIEAFDNDGIKKVTLRFRQNKSILGRFIICNDAGSSTCSGNTINKDITVDAVHYGADHGLLEVDLLLLNKYNQQSKLATIKVLNWFHLPYGFISPPSKSEHDSAISFSIEAFNNGFKEVGLTLKQNGKRFVNLMICDATANACTEDRINKVMTLNPSDYDMLPGIITIDLWSIDEKNIHNDLATLDLYWITYTPLNDTGITWSGDESDNYGDCSTNIDAAQDCYRGRDAQTATGKLTKIGSGIAGFDFTKLDSNGNALTNQDGIWDDNGKASDGSKWSCIRDNHTGLIWEVKTNDGGIHDKENKYRWGGKTAIGKNHPNKKGNYYDDWDELIDGANSEMLCGSNNWRVPIKEELISIVDYGVNPAIDTDFFANTTSGDYWTSSPISNNSNDSWQLYFYDGIPYSDNRSNSARVRLVHFKQ